MNTATKVTVYSSESCVQCTATYRALDAKGIAYNVVTVDMDNEEMRATLRELGFMQLPVVLVNGIDQWSGFRPDKIDETAKKIGGTR